MTNRNGPTARPPRLLQKAQPALHGDEFRGRGPLQPHQPQDEKPDQGDHNRPGQVDRADLVKGYEVSKDEYILLTNEEIRSGSALRASLGEKPKADPKALSKSGEKKNASSKSRQRKIV